MGIREWRIRIIIFLGESFPAIIYEYLKIIKRFKDILKCHLLTAYTIKYAWNNTSNIYWFIIIIFIVDACEDSQEKEREEICWLIWRYIKTGWLVIVRAV